jgi:AraC family transcriptional activator of mtrCDE
VREVRLREAARMLRQSSLPVDTVAGRTGFASRSHFSRAFRDLFGQSPSAYRSPS